MKKSSVVREKHNVNKKTGPGRKKGVAPKRPKGTTRQFDAVLNLIEQARAHTLAAVNVALIDLYWNIGEYISRRIDSDEWGKATVKSLSDYILKKRPGVRGYSASNLWRMRQFYDVWQAYPKLAPLVRVLSWSHNLILLSRCQTMEEREFYLKMAIQERWSRRQLERQISGALFERSCLDKPILSTVLRELHPEADKVFKDAYFVEFLDLPESHSEADLHKGLCARLRDFLLELGRGFCFVGSEYPVQVGKNDFSIDLLFFNRDLNCLVAFELKVDEFKPEYLGKLEFYLEALDRKHRKSHERPAIGVLLCKTRDAEVVEFALSRSLSPALIAEYRTRLPNKKLLRQKLQEFYDSEVEPVAEEHPRSQSLRSRGDRK